MSSRERDQATSEVQIPQGVAAEQPRVSAPAESKSKRWTVGKRVAAAAGAIVLAFGPSYYTYRVGKANARAEYRQQQQDERKKERRQRKQPAYEALYAGLGLYQDRLRVCGRLCTPRDLAEVVLQLRGPLSTIDLYGSQAARDLATRVDRYATVSPTNFILFGQLREQIKQAIRTEINECVELECD
jgi:hypothetical protein